jgi:hypothetical protein
MSLEAVGFNHSRRLYHLRELLLSQLLPSRPIRHRVLQVLVTGRTEDPAVVNLLGQRNYEVIQKGKFAPEPNFCRIERSTPVHVSDIHFFE